MAVPFDTFFEVTPESSMGFSYPARTWLLQDQSRVILASVGLESAQVSAGQHDVRHWWIDCEPGCRGPIHQSHL